MAMKTYTVGARA